MRRTELLLAALILVGGVGHPSTSRACSVRQHGIESRWSFPANGATGVPTNTRVVVVYFALEPLSNIISTNMPGVALGGDLHLRRRDSGESVAFTSTRQGAGYNGFAPQVAFVLQSGAPLAASTAYEVLDRRAKLPCGPSYPRAPCDHAELTVIAAFTTGDTADATPPPAPTGASLKYEGLGRCTSLGCCGSYVVQNYSARWDAPEVAGSVLYNLYSGDMASPQLLQDNQVPLAASCTGGGDPSRLLVLAGDIQVRAVDWAGNESPAARVGIIPPKACENTEGGCSAGGAPAGGGWLVAAGLAAAALRSRRRRFSARPGGLWCFRR